MANSHDDTIRDTVRTGYAKIAESGSLNAAEGSDCGCGPGGCCGGSDADTLAKAVGYDAAELANLPDGANMGLSCGNPTALASLQSGERVVDLGSGGGFDCFLAGPKVGAKGQVIGVDMTAEMVTKARRNTTTYRERSGLDNVEFRLGEIEHLPLADSSVDVVISNCVINLSPNKSQVWKEIARVLAPGGRAAVSDLALLKPLPEAVVGMVEALVGCIAGAELIEATRANIEAAGLTVEALEPKLEYVATMDKWQDPMYQQIAAALPEGETLAEYVTSLNITTRKDQASCF